MTRLPHAVLSVALLFVCMAGPTYPATAEANPLGLPDWVKPGAQIVYHNAKSGTGGTGSTYAIFNVLHVNEEGLVVSESGVGVWLRPDGVRSLHLAGAPPHFIDPIKLRAGMSIVMPPGDVAAARSGGNVVVSFEPFVMPDSSKRSAMYRTIVNGSRTTYVKDNDPSRILFRENDRSLLSQAFDVETGLLLRDLHRQYEDATGFNKDNQPTNSRTRLAVGTTLTFQNLRQIDGPWIGQTWPAWTRTVKRLTYSGVTRQPTAQGMLNFPTEFSMEVKTRPEGAAVGIATLSFQNPMNGQVQRMPAPFIESTNALGGMWMSPEALRAIVRLGQQNNGIVDVEPVTKTTTTVHQDGNQVILTVQSTGGDRVTTVYSLDRGIAERLHRVEANTGRITNLQLQRTE